ncbi:hypothetical protein [Christiangramia portivictoriae]|uniref:hypothetical protein n=1 Tax=Christiangramia portivictoriae TaxID=326069 RepID=UPI0004216C9C|nr:hypothetical protein [Christiangramia portivictoriae]
MNFNTEWDPLQNSDNNLDAEMLSAAKKRQIKNILKSYVGTYDPFSELIQNAMDAVDTRKIMLEEENYSKKIYLKIDLQENAFLISDNGIGFRQTEFYNFLAPDISFKDGEKTRGNKGVGATYLGYGFNYFQIATKTPDFNFSGEVKDGRAWVEDTKGLIERPKVKKSEYLHKIFHEIERGSSFVIKFGGEHTRPKNLSYFNASNADQWLYLLLIKTPLGNIDLFDEQEDKIFFEIEVVDKNGNITKSDNLVAKYIYPHSKITASGDIKQILQTQSDLIQAGKDPGNLPKKFKRLNGLFEYYNSEDLKKLPSTKIKDDEKNLIDEFKVTAYGYFSYSTSVWDELNDNIANLRKGLRILRGGLQLANNYMPQGDLITIPLTSNIGYQNQAHILVHFKNADPDLGRKGFQPELKELAEDISVAIINKIKRFKHLLKKDTGEKPKIQEEVEIRKWVNDQETYEKNNPLLINNEHFFKPIHEVSITSIPQSEQDVIVLFNQLIAGGVIRGLKLLATSQIKQYDGVFKYYIQEPLSNHVFDKVTNPLGVSELETTNEFISIPYILEYKYNVDALIREFENQDKKERDVNLVVAWELGELYKRNYEVTSLLHLDNLHHRQFHGLTHILDSGTSQIQAIILKELVEYLNDVDGVQEWQSEQYDESLNIE